ncbi:MAG: hypothetical protein ACTSW7_00975 [Candidatus Thorarchaeota archaeon]|nr:MAG: hypothetical protein DRQ25_04795 [Candidatus Fermentibacteria bacterium]HEC72051.1 hypothetical protein [Thermoplasmatales archaeon]
MAKKNPLVTTAKIKGKVYYFVDGVGPKGPHVEARGDSVKFINPDDEETPKRDMSYVGSAIKLMVEANQ